MTTEAQTSWILHGGKVEAGPNWYVSDGDTFDFEVGEKNSDGDDLPRYQVDILDVPRHKHAAVVIKQHGIEPDTHIVQRYNPKTFNLKLNNGMICSLLVSYLG